MTRCHPFPATAAASTAGAVSWAGRVESAYHWLFHARHTAHPDHPVWHFRWNWHKWKTRLLAHLGLEQHPDKTFIGRVTRGFDFLGVDFQPGAPLAPSAVSLARKTEKIARLHEQGASPERIGRYRQHWQKWLHGLIGQPTPAGSTPPEAISPPSTPVRSLSHRSSPSAIHAGGACT